MSEGAGEGFSATFEVLGGTDKHNETWTGMKTSWNNQCLQTPHSKLCFLSFWCNSSHVGSLHSLAYQSLSTTDWCCKNARKSAFSHHLPCSLHLSVLRCNTWATWKKHESSWGKCVLICFRLGFIAVSSLTSSMKLPSQRDIVVSLGIPQAQISKQDKITILSRSPFPEHRYCCVIKLVAYFFGEKNYLLIV